MYKEHSGPWAGQYSETLSLIDEGNRFVMIEKTIDSSSTVTSVTRYQHPNHQGSTTLETNENGEVITYEEYHPFGTTSYQAINGSVTASAKRYRYTGMERDDETGLEYHNARYYIPWLGRWMNCDPIGIGDGVNVYAYCRNNPVGNVDISGHEGEPGSGLLAVSTGGSTASSEGAKASANMAELVKKAAEAAKVKKQNELLSAFQKTHPSKTAAKPLYVASPLKAASTANVTPSNPKAETQTTPAESPKGPQLIALTNSDIIKMNARLKYQAQEKYFEGMADFNRVMITNPATKIAAQSIFAVGTLGVGSYLASGLSTSVTFNKVGEFFINGSLSAGSSVVGQAAFNNGFSNVDYGDVGIAFLLHKPTIKNAILGAGFATGIDIKSNQKTYLFGLRGISKSNGQLAYDFTTSLALNLINVKVGKSLDNLENAAPNGGSFFIKGGVPYLSNALSYGGQTYIGNKIFETKETKPVSITEQ